VLIVFALEISGSILKIDMVWEMVGKIMQIIFTLETNCTS